MLREDPQLGERQRHFADNIWASGDQLLGLVNDVLDVAKMESGQVEVRLSDFSIELVIATQCDVVRSLAEKKNISLSYSVPPGLPPVHLDQERVQRILTNLLSNAIKFTPEGGVVQVLLTVDKGNSEELDPQTASFVIQVRDTGVGIPEEELQTIFEKFRQGSSAIGVDMTTREHSGTGLGLSIVRETCRLLHGDVSVQSALGAGSTFTVRLPWKISPKPVREEIVF